MSEAQDMLDVIELMTQKSREEATKIYKATITAINTNTKCSAIVNGKTYSNIYYYGDAPTINSQYRIFVPEGNMSDSFIIVGGGSGSTPTTYVTSVNGQTGNVPLNANDVGALPNTTVIPTKTSQLTNDSGFINSIPLEYVTDTEMQAYAQPKGDYATNASLNTEITNRQAQDTTLQQNIDNVNNKIDNLQSVQILNKSVINSTISNIQTTCTNYIVTEYGRQPKNLDGLIITLTDSTPVNDKVQYVYSSFSSVWVDTGTAQTQVSEGSKTTKGVVQVGDGINVVGGVINTDKSTIGLGNVDNTSDANKPISIATQNALNDKAPITSPSFLGIPTAPTADSGTNTAQIATTEFVQKAIVSTSQGIQIKVQINQPTNLSSGDFWYEII